MKKRYRAKNRSNRVIRITLRPGDVLVVRARNN